MDNVSLTRRIEYIARMGEREYLKERVNALERIAKQRCDQGDERGSIIPRIEAARGYELMGDLERAGKNYQRLSKAIVTLDQRDLEAKAIRKAAECYEEAIATMPDRAHQHRCDAAHSYFKLAQQLMYDKRDAEAREAFAHGQELFREANVDPTHFRYARDVIAMFREN